MKKIALLFCFLFSCSEKENCTADATVVKRFRHAEKIIQNFNENSDIPVSDWFEARVFLEAITKIERMDSVNDMGYSHENAKNRDLALWRKWFEENKCKYNAKQLDSILNTSDTWVWLKNRS